MNPQENKYSEEAYKIAELALELWKENPKFKELEGSTPGLASVMGALRLVSLSESQLKIQNLISEHEKLDAGRTPFAPLLEQDKQVNLPEGEIRTLGRITSKDSLVRKILDVFPTRNVFSKIDEFVSYQSAAEGAYLFRSMSTEDMTKRALEKCEELDKEELTLYHLSLYCHYRRNGFSPNDLKRYPFQDEPEHERFRLFRAGEDICEAGWLSQTEKEIISKACRTSKTGQEKQ